MNIVERDKKHSFLQELRDYFSRSNDTQIPAPGQKLRLSGKGLRIPWQGFPFAIEMGKQHLHIYPDPIVNNITSPPDFILFDPRRYPSGISQLLRLSPDQKLAITHDSNEQKYVFSHPKEAFRRHLQIFHEGNALIFKDPISELGTYVSLLRDDQDISRLRRHRQQALRRIIDIYNGPIQLLPPDEAMAALKQVNRLLQQDPYRRQDSYGNVGGLVELPAHLTPVVVGDLHAQVNNLLKILSENAFMKSLEQGEAALIFLGDAIHPETPGQLDYMDSSLLIMDLIFKLKCWFPSQVFFLIGNHDSFAPEVMKGGVPQSLLWDKRVTQLRGTEYREEMALFYRQSPVTLLSKDFFACHAGPSRHNVSLETLVDIRHHPHILHELTWTRLQRPVYPAGYTRSDVRRFRKSLALEKHFPFIIGHYPLSRG